MPQPEQFPQKSIMEGNANDLKNNIQGLEYLNLLTPLPEGSRTGTLTDKVRRSIERKIVNRQKKIEDALNTLSACADPGALNQAVSGAGILGEITKLLQEQSDIIEKESLGNVDPRPFQGKVTAVEALQRDLLPRLVSGNVTVSDEVKKLQKVLVPRAERGTEANPSAVPEDPRESMTDQLLSAGMKDPEILRRVAARLPAAVALERESLAATKELRESAARSREEGGGAVPPAFQRIIANVEGARGFSRQREGKTIWVSNTKIATDIRRMLRIIASEEFKAKRDTERERVIRDSIKRLATDRRLQADLLAACTDAGWLHSTGRVGTEKSTERALSVGELQARASAQYEAFKQSIVSKPSFETLAPFLFEGGVEQIEALYRAAAEAARRMEHPPVAPETLETLMRGIRAWRGSVASRLQSGQLIDQPEAVRQAAADLDNIFQPQPRGQPKARTASGKSVAADNTIAAGRPASAPTLPPSPVPVPKPPEAKKEEEKKGARGNKRAAVSDEEKAQVIHDETTKRETLLAQFDAVAYDTPQKALTAAISLIKELRESLARQSAADRKLGKEAELADKEEQLGAYLKKLTAARAKGEALQGAAVVSKEIKKIIKLPIAEAALVRTSGTTTMEELEAVGLATTQKAVVPAAPAGPLLHEQPPTTDRAEPGNQLFQKFVQEVEQRGVFTGLGERNTPEILQRCFEARANVARSIVELYTREGLEHLGLPFGLENIGKSVSAYIEKLSLEQPETVIALSDLVAKKNESAAAVAALEERRGKIVSGEELKSMQDSLSKEQKVFELAQASNRFWAGLWFWKGEGFGRLTLRKDLREARKEVRGKGYGTFLGGISAKIDGKLAEIRTQISEAGNASVVEKELLEARRRLAEVKSEIMRACGAHDEVAEMLRKSVTAAITKISARADIASLEKGEEALVRLHESVEAGDSASMDYLRSVDTDNVRKLIRAASEARAQETVRRSLEEVLKTPQAPGRLLALKAELAALTSRKKIGGFEGQNSVLAFIKSEIQEYYNRELAPTIAVVTERKKVLDERNKDKKDADKEALPMSSEEASIVLRDRIIRDLLSDPLFNPPLPKKPKVDEAKPTVLASPSAESHTAASPSVENLEARLGRIKGFDELQTVLSEFSTIQFRGQEVKPGVVKRYFRNIGDELKEGTLRGDIRMDFGCEELFSKHLPDISTIMDKEQSGLQVAVRRVCIEPLIQAVSGDAFFVAFSALSDKSKEQVRNFLTEEGKKLFDEEKAKGIYYYPSDQVTGAQKKIIEAVRRILKAS